MQFLCEEVPALPSAKSTTLSPEIFQTMGPEAGKDLSIFQRLVHINNTANSPYSPQT